jgi:hypothetical protein
MVLFIARWEAGPCERWPKTLKGELENKSRKARDLVSDSLKKGQITLSQGKMKKDDLADDEDDDVERTSVSRDRVTVTLCAVQLRSLALDTGRWCTMDLCSALP